MQFRRSCVARCTKSKNREVNVLLWVILSIPSFKRISANGVSSCWTCRKRRVKCDERPFTCGTCEKARLVCAGYDLQLIWNAGPKGKIHKPHPGRRRIKPGESATFNLSHAGVTITDSTALDRNTYHPMAEDEVVEALANIEKSAMSQASTTIGPFSVFCLQSSSRAYGANACSGSVKAGMRSPTHEVFKGSDESALYHPKGSLAYNGESLSVNTDIALNPLVSSFDPVWDPVTDSLGSLANTTGCHTSYPEQETVGVSVQELNPESSIFPSHNGIDTGRRTIWTPFTLASSKAQKVSLGLSETNDTESRSNPWEDIPLYQTNSLLQGQGPMPLGCNLTKILTENTTATMLMNHYAKHMVHLMQPVFHPRNPFKTIYLPLAIKGSSELELTTNSDRVYPASVTVFHSLMSAAAVSLRSLQLGEENLQHLACYHKQRALTTLRSALAAQSSSYKDLMIAILSLVSTDVSIPKTYLPEPS